MARTIDGIPMATITKQTIINANNAMIKRNPRKLRRLNITRTNQQLGVTLQRPTTTPNTTTARFKALTAAGPTTNPYQPSLARDWPLEEEKEVEKFMPFWKKVRRFFGIK